MSTLVFCSHVTFVVLHMSLQMLCIHVTRAISLQLCNSSSPNSVLCAITVMASSGAAGQAGHVTHDVPLGGLVLKFQVLRVMKLKDP